MSPSDRRDRLASLRDSIAPGRMVPAAEMVEWTDRAYIRGVHQTIAAIYGRFGRFLPDREREILGRWEDVACEMREGRRPTGAALDEIRYAAQVVREVDSEDDEP